MCVHLGMIDCKAVEIVCLCFVRCADRHCVLCMVSRRMCFAAFYELFWFDRCILPSDG